MRRFARHLFTLIAMLSLLLCVTTAALWPRSYYRSDAVRFIGLPVAQYVVLYSGAGGLLFGASPTPASAPRTWFYTSEEDPEPAGAGPANRVWFDRFGFGVRTEQPPFRIAGLSVWVPHWFAMLVLSLLPARWAMAHSVRRHRQRYGLCLACGYDLRASSGLCPECGVPAPAYDEARLGYHSTTALR